MIFITNNIEEAVFLADRIIVLTNCPSHVEQEQFIRQIMPDTTELLQQSNEPGTSSLVRQFFVLLSKTDHSVDGFYGQSSPHLIYCPHKEAYP